MLALVLFALCITVYSLKIMPLSLRIGSSIYLEGGPSFNSEPENVLALNELKAAMKNARMNVKNRLSPGAGLATADEQSDAAYADLINTSIDHLNDSQSDEELALLAKGGHMWEKGAKSKSNKLGFFGDLMNVFEALSGGAHIEKNKFGET